MPWGSGRAFAQPKGTGRLLITFLLGLGLGFAGSILVGPISVVIAESALSNRPRRGLAIAAGAAMAESIYALLAFSGLRAFLINYPALRPASRAFAGLVLCLVGIYLIRRRMLPVERADAPRSPPEARAFLLGVTLALGNPTLAVTWAVAVAALDAVLSTPLHASAALPFSLGAALGIMAWFWILIRVMCGFRRAFAPASVNRILRGTGVALVAAGLVLTGRVILHSGNL